MGVKGVLRNTLDFQLQVRGSTNISSVAAVTQCIDPATSLVTNFHAWIVTYASAA